MITTEVREYAVCYFDLLGQREGLLKKVRESDDIASLQDEIEKVSDLIRSFNKSLLNAHEQIKERSDEVLRLWGVPEKEMPPFLERMKQVHLGIQQFSDTTLFYVGAKDGDGMGFGMFLSFCLFFAGYYLQLIANGLPLRGSIVLGKGWEILPNCLYGPVMEDAYCLESSVASFPRIIVDKNVIQRVRDLDKEAESLHLPTRFSGCFDVDFDGLYIFDYLSKSTIGWLESLGIDRRIVLDSVARGLRSIRTTLAGFRQAVDGDCRNAIRARKYALLQSYWMQRTGLLENYFDEKPPQLENAGTGPKQEGNGDSPPCG